MVIIVFQLLPIAGNREFFQSVLSLALFYPKSILYFHVRDVVDHILSRSLFCTHCSYGQYLWFDLARAIRTGRTCEAAGRAVVGGWYANNILLYNITIDASVILYRLSYIYSRAIY